MSDAVVVDGLTPGILSMLQDDYQDWAEDEPDDEDLFVLALSPDALHKDNISGDSPVGIAIGDDDWYPEFTDDSGMDFLRYLRNGLLTCGGFPGLQTVTAFDELRAELTANLPSF